MQKWNDFFVRRKKCAVKYRTLEADECGTRTKLKERKSLDVWPDDATRCIAV